jgi:hypothetical protein
MGDTVFIRKALFTIGGFLIWGTHFGFLYIFNALACAKRFAGLSYFGFGVVPLMAFILTAIALLATALVLLLGYLRRGPANVPHDDRPVDEFMRYTTIAVAALSLVAIAWNGLPALIVPPCG